MKEEGMTEEEVEKAVGMFERGELDDLMKMKKEMEKKHGKKGGKKGEDKKLLSEKEGKKGEKKGDDKKKFVMLSEDDDMEDMKKAMAEFEKAGPKEKEAMLEEGKKAVGMFERGELDDLMKMKKEMEKKHGKKGGKKGDDKKFALLSEDDDMEDMKKAMEEFEKAG